MTEPIVFRKTFAILVVTLLQTAMPPLVAVGSLYVSTSVFSIPFDREFGILSAFVVVMSLLLLQPPRSFGSHLTGGRWPIAISVVLRWALMFVLLLILGYLTKSSEDFSRRVIVLWALMVPCVLTIGTLGLHEWMRRLVYDRWSVRRAIVAGYNEISYSMAKKIKDNPDLCLSVEGFFDDRSATRLGVNGDIQLRGGLSDIAAYMKTNAVDVIFVALPIRHIRRVMDLLDDLRDTTASIYYVPDIFVFDLIQARTSDILGIPVVAMCETPFYGYRGLVKRLIDILVSVGALVAFLPLMLLIGCAVKASSPGPVIFKQRRYGLDGRQISVYKFRTMSVTEDGNAVQQATKQDARVTPVGRILRRYSLDELPQLINVLQGKMSLVGPRPHAVVHNEEYRKLIKGYMVRHKVLPGITGLAQVNGCRGETSALEDMEARLKYDLEYLRHWSPALDLKILALTAVKMFRDDQAY